MKVDASSAEARTERERTAELLMIALNKKLALLFMDDGGWEREKKLSAKANFL